MINTDFEKAFDAFRSYTSIKYDEDWPVVNVENNHGYMTFYFLVPSNHLTKRELKGLLSACFIFELILYVTVHNDMLNVVIEASDEIIQNFISTWLPKD